MKYFSTFFTYIYSPLLIFFCSFGGFFKLSLESSLNALDWDRQCNWSSCLLFFFSRAATSTDLYVALHTLLNFSSGSAQTHAFQMVLKKASLWLWCTLLLAHSRSHYAVTFRKKLRQKAYFCFQLWSSVSVRQQNHNLQMQNSLVLI